MCSLHDTFLEFKMSNFAAWLKTSFSWTQETASDPRSRRGRLIELRQATELFGCFVWTDTRVHFRVPKFFHSPIPSEQTPMHASPTAQEGLLEWEQNPLGASPGLQVLTGLQSPQVSSSRVAQRPVNGNTGCFRAQCA